jgi:hypothetical protein
MVNAQRAFGFSILGGPKKRNQSGRLMPQDDQQRCAYEPRDEVGSIVIDQDEHVDDQNVDDHRERCECPEESGFYQWGGVKVDQQIAWKSL